MENAANCISGYITFSGGRQPPLAVDVFIHVRVSDELCGLPCTCIDVVMSTIVRDTVDWGLSGTCGITLTPQRTHCVSDHAVLNH